MRSSLVGASVTLLALALGCGKSEPDSGNPAAVGESDSGRGGTAGGGADGVGGVGGDNPAGGKAGGAGAGTSGGSDSGGGPTGEAGEGASGGGTLVSCDATKVSCKRAAPQCATGEVPSVAGNCYGECVKIEQCACSDAEQCPEPNQYTCWARQHCGPFVR